MRIGAEIAIQAFNSYFHDNNMTKEFHTQDAFPRILISFFKPRGVIRTLPKIPMMEFY